MYDWIVPEAEVIVQDPIQDTRRFVKDSGKAAEVCFQVEVTKSHRFSIVKNEHEKILLLVGSSVGNFWRGWGRGDSID